MEMETNNGLSIPVMLAAVVLTFVLATLGGCAVSGSTFYMVEKHHDETMVVRVDCGSNTGSIEAPIQVCDVHQVNESEADAHR